MNKEYRYFIRKKCKLNFFLIPDEYRIYVVNVRDVHEIYNRITLPIFDDGDVAEFFLDRFLEIKNIDVLNKLKQIGYRQWEQ